MTEFVQVLVSGIADGSTLALIALAFAIVYKGTGVINFAQGEMAALTAFIGYWLSHDLHVPYGIMFVVVALSGCVLGYLIELLLVGRGGRSILIVGVATIGVYYIVDAITDSVFGFGAIPRTVNGLTGGRNIHIGSAVVPAVDLEIVVVAVVCMIILTVFYRYSRWGTAMRAAADDPLAASMMGVDPRRVSRISWTLAGALGSIAGLLVAEAQFLQWGFMQPLLILALTAGVLGGLLSLPGVVLGGIIVGVSTDMFGAYVSSNMQDAWVFLLIVVMLIARPQGLLQRQTVIKV